MTQLKQRVLLTKKEFYLERTGVKVISKSASENLEYTVKYEEIGFDQVKKQEKGALFPAIFFWLMVALDLFLLYDTYINEEGVAMQGFWAFAGLFFGAMAVMATMQINRKVIFLTGGSKVLELLSNNPSTQEVDAFIEALYERIKNVYKSKYAVIDPNLPEELMMERINWLFEMGVITQEEQEDYYMQIQINSLLS
ncbi:hypothetical protein TH61_12760 [Rufibacter sp. DG15C]|uniref:hypothetical protein n=1 Tax=Rufibacter sp. DG15C TaxID=1379909 RepID=UPI00078EDD6D|nr:hypothetical protein [Rufibacter sp. DG15C]AMM51874.1 hypothetical protein TH61_12760 [Rufibacter sp. DG15C]